MWSPCIKMGVLREMGLWPFPFYSSHKGVTISPEIDGLPRTLPFSLLLHKPTYFLVALREGPS